MTSNVSLYGGIELGGTKIVCAVGNGSTGYDAKLRVQTGNPRDDFEEIVDFFEKVKGRLGPLRSIGVACFGPLDLNPHSNTYGQILQTTKPGWSNFPVRNTLLDRLRLPVSITTDVNGAILAEQRLGAAKGSTDCIYVTIGTGVGGGIMLNGQLLKGRLHPELGHMRVPTNGVKGICCFHGDCLEGLISGPAIAQRAGVPTENLRGDSPIWLEVANSLADMCNNLIMILSPQKIILGGGVMNHSGLIEMVREQTLARVGNYLDVDSLAGSINELIVPPSIKNDSGLVGALLLAEQAARPI